MGQQLHPPPFFFLLGTPDYGTDMHWDLIFAHVDYMILRSFCNLVA